MSNMTAAASTTFNSFSNLGALLVPLSIAIFLLLLTSARVFSILTGILGKFTLWVQRVIEGAVMFYIGRYTYILGLQAQPYLTLGALVYFGKYLAIFTVIGIVSAKTRDKIAENAGFDFHNWYHSFDMKEES